jgi:hypothetical protein
MNSFIKIVLLLIVAVIAVKLLPLMFGLGWLLAGALLGLLALGASAFAVMMAGGLLLAALLSPLWIPVLVIIGVIALVKRGARRSGGVVA